MDLEDDVFGRGHGREGALERGEDQLQRAQALEPHARRHDAHYTSRSRGIGSSTGMHRRGDIGG
eukprot:3179116-Rhodomonas_salina.1